MKLPTLTAKHRQRLYLTGLAALPILAGYRIIDQAAVPLWADLLGNALGITVAGTAFAKIKQQRDDGTLQ